MHAGAASDPHRRRQQEQEQQVASNGTAGVFDSRSTPVLLDDQGREMFVKGVGTHTWQSSGDESSNWSHILRSWKPLNFARFAMARLSGGLTVLESGPNSWDRYEEDADLAAGLGCNGFRLSLEWSRLEPRQGVIDLAAVTRFRAIFASLLSRGMTPNVTLHHFTQPQWFDDLGGWTKEENIQLFVNYAVKAVELFGDQVQLWATFNEPTSTSTMGFIFGAYPPGELLGLTTAGRVLLHMCRAHTAAYYAIKALPGGEQHKIGMAQMWIPFDNFPDLGPLTALSRFAARWITFWWGYDLIHEWLLTGKFSWLVPSLTGGGSRCAFEVHDPKPPLDWFGVNFYSRPVISPFLTPGRKPWQVLSDLGYPLDPEGMHQVVVRSAQYRVPIYVTEAGVSIASQRHRQWMVDSYMKEILRALAEGVDVRGIYYWTLVDNFEWNGGYGIKFGLYEWSPWPWGKDRAERAAAGTLRSFYKMLPNTLDAARKTARLMDLSHAETAPAPRSIYWWAFTLLLLYAQLLEAAWQWLRGGVSWLLAGR